MPDAVAFWSVAGLLLCAALIALVGLALAHRQRLLQCPLCDGSGLAAGETEDNALARPCPLCGGTGQDIPPPREDPPVHLF